MDETCVSCNQQTKTKKEFEKWQLRLMTFFLIATAVSVCILLGTIAMMFLGLWDMDTITIMRWAIMSTVMGQLYLMIFNA